MRERMNTGIAGRIISRMTFSAADYVKDRESILAEALLRYTDQTGERSPEVRSEMSVLLERSFSERKELSVVNAALPDHFRDGSRFSVCVDDTVVEGLVHLSPKVLLVEMISPQQGHRAGSELKILAPVIWTERPEANSEANEEGRKKAVSLLTDIYYSILQ